MNEKNIYLENEKKANKALAFTSLVLAGILLVTLILNLFKVKAFLYDDTINLMIAIMFPILIVALALPSCLLKTKLSGQSWFKYHILISFVVSIGVVGFLVPQEGIFFAACLVASTLYFKPKATSIVFYISLVLMVVAPVLALALDTGYNPDMYNFFDNKWVALFVFAILPRVLALVVIAQITNGLTKRSKILLDEQINEVKRNQKVTSELSIASVIQGAVLPKEFPDTAFGEIYGLMDSAKEVGGDFYDFFNIDENHLAIVIGDASGKGIPSSLYMMKTQSLIRAFAKNSVNTAKIINDVNASLCEGNDYSMFVTCWIGILDKESGVLKYTNAGHNPPIVKSGDKFEYLSAKPGLVLGGFCDFEYKEASVKLHKGDKLFLYTDGVTEAHNVRSELYGEDRLLEKVSKLDASPYETVTRIREDVREFSRNAEQFDDITMLMVEYRKPQSVFSKRFEAKRDNLENVQNFIISSIKAELTAKDKNELLIVSEEVFINIASYAYEGRGYCNVDVNYENGVLTLVFTDNGVEFNPLEKDDPNTKQKAEDRQIGGLGIFMVKNLMDKVYYEYKDGKNILSMIKKY